MLDMLNSLVMSIMDPLLGWLLYLPTDVILFVVGIGTSCILTGVRLFTTDQEFLRWCDHDKKRLKERMKEAKKKGDKEELLRCKNLKTLIALRSLKQELLPLLAALVPIALLGTWCFNRLGFHPPRPGEPVEVIAYFPVSKAGGVVHIVPEKGVAAEEGWIKEIVPVTEEGPPYSEARWKLRFEPRAEPYTLRIHYGKKIYEKEITMGGRTYSPSVTFYDDALTCVETVMKEVKLFGVVPGIPAIWFPPWLVAYLLIAVPFVFVVKRVFRIY